MYNNGLGSRIYDFLKFHRYLPFRSIGVFNWLLQAALMGGLLILVVLLLRAVARKKVHSRVLCLAWLLVAVRLLVPVALPNPLMNELRPTYSVDEAARPIADQIRVRGVDALNELGYQMQWQNYNSARQRGEDVDSYFMSHEPNLADCVQSFAYAASYGWAGKWLLIIWGAAGAAVLVTRTGIFLIRRRKLTGSRRVRADESLCDEYAAMCRHSGHKALPLWICDGTDVPVRVGILHPWIALPADLPVEMLSAALRRQAVRSGMYPFGAVARELCLAVQWFNPLVWIASVCARHDMEYACDEAAVLSSGDAGAMISLIAERSGRHAAAKARAAHAEGLKKPVRSAALAMALLFTLLTLLSCFTAEGGQMDLQIRAARTMWWLDDPYPDFTEPVRGQVEAQPCETAEAAIQQAKQYMQALVPITSMYDAEVRYQAAPCDEGWYVVTGMSETAFMLIARDGRLLKYSVGQASVQRYTGSGNLPSNMADVAQQGVRWFAAMALQSDEVRNVHITGDWFNLSGRYITLQAEIDNRTCTLLFNLSGQFQLISYSTSHGNSMNTPPDAAMAKFRENMMSRYGLDASGYAAKLLWNSEEDAWVAAAYVGGEDAAGTSLPQEFGDRFCYCVEQHFPANGSAPGELTETVIPVLQDIELPQDAVTGQLPVPSECYFDWYGELFRQENLSAGTAYTLLREGDSGDAMESGMALIRYTDGDVTRDRWVNAATLRGVDLQQAPETYEMVVNGMPLRIADFYSPQDLYTDTWVDPASYEDGILHKVLSMALDTLSANDVPMSIVEAGYIEVGLLSSTMPDRYWYVSIHVTDIDQYSVTITPDADAVINFYRPTDGNG